MTVTLSSATIASSTARWALNCWTAFKAAMENPITLFL